ncbi:nucleoside 2-deoxyribosyltransferase [Patescibacteria group bacterium]|nr:nucleoside 2-deoxyribosyltransferase [Patescibacteria group bacterium]MBU4274630.1 nucleoside 2-deoxyribosyltransferase [Patescibacteria group bacterium]MBU4367676.1 nucleoside 2-deoxyribosyltransferase [Patescibacteria group bacterium]MBU4461874.1 nucleoside 2-deoxyribosyltransferase [Patescibacteria group bacterium]MCG2699995.1 nucleoside 2-deoxyribosyltransferase [Candidatus Parcubacteria bacterium]
MKIYFAGSIRGGRENNEEYFKMIQHLKQYGDVLSEHVGAKTIDDLGEKNLTDEYIFERDVNWVKEADVVIAEVSTPSLGVGYELRLAEELNKKILCLFRDTGEKKLSAMISGNNKLIIKEYKTTEDCFNLIDKFLTK